MTRRGRVRAAIDQGAEKRRNPLAFSEAAPRPNPVTSTTKRTTVLVAVVLFVPEVGV